MKSGIAPYVPPDTLEATLKAQRDHLHATRDRAILLLSHYMGLRSKELAALRIGDVFDPNTGAIKEVVRLMPSMTKGAKFREGFLVNARAREVLRQYLQERSLRHLDAPLFHSQKGNGFTANSMQRLLRICYQRAGVQASSHSGRRSFATHLIQSGADIYSIQRMLGHASITTTQKYFSTSTERLKQLASMLA